MYKNSTKTIQEAVGRRWIPQKKNQSNSDDFQLTKKMVMVTENMIWKGDRTDIDRNLIPNEQKEPVLESRHLLNDHRHVNEMPHRAEKTVLIRDYLDLNKDHFTDCGFFPQMIMLLDASSASQRMPSSWLTRSIWSTTTGSGSKSGTCLRTERGTRRIST